jgi:hypothetical protein
MRNSNTPYNVLRYTNHWEMAPRDPISSWLAAASIGSTATAVAAGTVAVGFKYYAVYALSTIAISVVTSAVLGALMPKPSLGSLTSDGLLTNGRSALSPSEFVYGQIRKGGQITFLESTDTNNKILHQILVLAGHEVEEIGDIYLNDQIVTMTNENVTSTPWQRTTTTHERDSDGDITSTTTVVDNFLKIYKHLGNQTSENTPFANSTSTLANTLINETSATSSFVGKGQAYVYLRMEFDQDAFTDGIPTITAVVKGKKVVKTINGTPQTAAYSNNAAWCMRDYLTSSYGLNDPSIDYATFEAAAVICDDTTVLSDGTPQYTMNGVVGANEPVGTVLQNMTTTCGGTLFWGAGYWRLFAGAFVAPTKTLTLDDFRSGISLDTKVSMRDNYNAVRGTFIDSGSDYVSTDYPQINSANFLAEDNGFETVLDLTLPYTTNPIAAQRIARQMLYRGREQLTMSADFGMNAFDVEVGDFIKIRNERYGWGSSAEKTFEVTGWQLKPDADGQDLRVNLTLRESSLAAFGFGASDEQTITSNNTTLLNYYEVPSIGVSVSQAYREVNENLVTALVVEVTSTNINRIDSVILKYRRSGIESNSQPYDWVSVGQSILVNDGINAGNFEIVGVKSPQINEAAINYTVSVTPVNSLGFRGDPTELTHDFTADLTPPSPPSSLSHNLSGGTSFFSWPAVTELDLSHYKLYYTSNFSANYGDASIGAAVVNKIARPATTITYPALSGKYFITSVDKTGNESTTASSDSILASELPQLGTTRTDVENPNFSGTPKSNVTVSGGNMYLTNYSTPTVGTYFFYHGSSLGYADILTSRTVRLSSSITVSRKHANAVSGEVLWDDIPNNWNTWPGLFDTWTDEDAPFNDYSTEIEARASTTVAGLQSETYVAASGEVVGRYIEFRVVLRNTTANVTPNITALSAIMEY